MNDINFSPERLASLTKMGIDELQALEDVNVGFIRKALDKWFGLVREMDITEGFKCLQDAEELSQKMVGILAERIHEEEKTAMEEFNRYVLAVCIKHFEIRAVLGLRQEMEIPEGP